MSPTYSVCRNHVYITGEVKKCPICGKATEIYSRITGYYRLIANWNDGKTKEYDMRKEYVLDNQAICKNDKGSKDEAAKEEAKVVESKQGKTKKILLFGTKTCPNCEIAKKKLNEKHVAYEFVDAEENLELTDEYEVMSAPTLIRVNEEGYDKVVNASNIINFLENEIKL